ncbi:MAG: alkanesulfonate monooxygenase [Gaiellales bacterium]|nr:alkanesulfonate monooxygenase [Gaiellales bacterium]
MSIEFIGLIDTREQSEIKRAPGPVIDREYTRRITRAHEDAGFDKVLIGTASVFPEGTQVAAYAAQHSERLGFLVSHRPGFVAPTVAARAFATLDQFAGGRISLHTITGGSDAEMARDGDHLTKDERYARTDEYLEILKLAWTSDEAFDYDGAYYQVKDFWTDLRSPQEPHIPLYFGGSSEAAFRVGGKHAHTFAIWGEPLAQAAEQVAAIRAAAAAAGRDTPPGISVSVRPILGATEQLAWERAHRILATTQDNVANARGLGSVMKRFLPEGPPPNAGSQRLLAAAEAGELHDRCLWTPLARATGAGGNTTALVGTPETVAAALLDYVDIGATTLLIRGYDPYEDAIDYGRDLIPLVRDEIASRERAAVGEPVATG